MAANNAFNCRSLHSLDSQKLRFCLSVSLIVRPFRMHQKQIAHFIAAALQCGIDDLLPLNPHLIVTLSSDANPNHWVSVYGNILDFAYSSQRPPNTFAQQIFAVLPSWQLVDWSPGRLATLEFESVQVQNLSAAVSLYFKAVHEAESYSISYSVKSFGRA